MISCRYCAAVVSWSLAAMLRVCTWPDKDPFGELAVAVESDARTSSIDRPTPASAPGSTETRTAGCCPPPTVTCPTPDTCEIFCARMVFAVSKSWAIGSVPDVNATIMMGASAGFAFR